MKSTQSLQAAKVLLDLNQYLDKNQTNQADSEITKTISLIASQIRADHSSKMEQSYERRNQQEIKPANLFSKFSSQITSFDQKDSINISSVWGNLSCNQYHIKSNAAISQLPLSEDWLHMSQQTIKSQVPYQKLKPKLRWMLKSFFSDSSLLSQRLLPFLNFYDLLKMRSLSKIFKTTIDKNLPDRLQEEAEFIHKHIDANIQKNESYMKVVDTQIPITSYNWLSENFEQALKKLNISLDTRKQFSSLKNLSKNLSQKVDNLFAPFCILIGLSKTKKQLPTGQFQYKWYPSFCSFFCKGTTASFLALEQIPRDLLDQDTVLSAFIELDNRHLFSDQALRKLNQNFIPLIQWCKALVSYHFIVHPYKIRSIQSLNSIITAYIIQYAMQMDTIINNFYKLKFALAKIKVIPQACSFVFNLSHLASNIESSVIIDKNTKQIKTCGSMQVSSRFKQDRKEECRMIEMFPNAVFQIILQYAVDKTSQQEETNTNFLRVACLSKFRLINKNWNCLVIKNYLAPRVIERAIQYDQMILRFNNRLKQIIPSLPKDKGFFIRKFQGIWNKKIILFEYILFNSISIIIPQQARALLLNSFMTRNKYQKKSQIGEISSNTNYNITHILEAIKKSPDQFKTNSQNLDNIINFEKILNSIHQTLYSMNQNQTKSLKQLFDQQDQSPQSQPIKCIIYYLKIVLEHSFCINPFIFISSSQSDLDNLAEHLNEQQSQLFQSLYSLNIIIRLSLKIIHQNLMWYQNLDRNKSFSVIGELHYLVQKQKFPLSQFLSIKIRQNIEFMQWYNANNSNHDKFKILNQFIGGNFMPGSQKYEQHWDIFQDGQEQKKQFYSYNSLRQEDVKLAVVEIFDKQPLVLWENAAKNCNKFSESQLTDDRYSFIFRIPDSVAISSLLLFFTQAQLFKVFARINKFHFDLVKYHLPYRAKYLLYQQLNYKDKFMCTLQQIEQNWQNYIKQYELQNLSIKDVIQKLNHFDKRNVAQIKSLRQPPKEYAGLIQIFSRLVTSFNYLSNPKNIKRTRADNSFSEQWRVIKLLFSNGDYLQLLKKENIHRFNSLLLSKLQNFLQNKSLSVIKKFKFRGGNSKLFHQIIVYLESVCQMFRHCRPYAVRYYDNIIQNETELKKIKFLDNLQVRRYYIQKFIKKDKKSLQFTLAHYKKQFDKLNKIIEILK